MQTNLKFNLLNFFTPVNSRTPENQAHAMISISPNKKTNTNYYIYVKHFLNINNLNWKHIRFAHNAGNLFMTEGNELNGFPVSVNGSVQNKQLLLDIFKLYDIKVPTFQGQREKINFNFYKVEEGLYILKKI